MNRAEALELADKLVERWVEAVKNNRGYIHDAWKPTDPEKRTDAVIKLAEFLMLPEPPPPFGTRLVDPVQVHTSLCTSCVQPRIEDPPQTCQAPDEHVRFS